MRSLTFEAVAVFVAGVLLMAGTAQAQIVQTGKLLADDAEAADWFGNAVAVEGDTAVVGAPIKGEGTTSGAAYVFRRINGAWTQQQKLTALDTTDEDQFGYAVAVSGDTIMIGAYTDSDAGYGSGSVYVFARNGSAWTQRQKLTALDAAAGNGHFGVSVAVQNDTAIIGAGGDSAGGFESGAAYVFIRSGGIWTQQQKLTARDAEPSDRFGSSVDFDGDNAIVGAANDDDLGFDSGAAYVFARAAGTWSQQQKLRAGDAGARPYFGSDVAISGDTVVSTTSGAAYVFARSGGTWIQQQKVTAADAAANDGFGYSVDISGDTFVVGAPVSDDTVERSGAAHVFARVSAGWAQAQKLTALDAASGDWFGVAAAISGGTVLVGALLDDDGGSEAGSAYVFAMPAFPAKVSGLRIVPGQNEQ